MRNVHVVTINGGFKVFRTEKEALDFAVDAYQYYIKENNPDIPEINREIMCEVCRNFLQKGTTFRSFTGFVANIHEQPLFSPIEK